MHRAFGNPRVLIHSGLSALLPATLFVALCVSVWEKPTLVYSRDSTEEPRPAACFNRGWTVAFQPLDMCVWFLHAVRIKAKHENTLTRATFWTDSPSHPSRGRVAGELETHSLAWHKSGIFFQLQITTDGGDKSDPRSWKNWFRNDLSVRARTFRWGSRDCAGWRA